MTAEEMYNSKTDSDDMEIVTDFAYLGLVISSNGGCSQEVKRRLSLRMAAMEELGKITKNKDVLYEFKVKIIHPLIIPSY